MLTDADVKRLARLARLHIDDDEAARMLPALGAVLDLAAALGQADTASVRPLANVHELLREDAGLRLRDDVVTEPADRREAYQAGAPAVERGLFLVPKVID